MWVDFCLTKTYVIENSWMLFKERKLEDSEDNIVAFHLLGPFDVDFLYVLPVTQFPSTSHRYTSEVKLNLNSLESVCVFVC